MASPAFFSFPVGIVSVGTNLYIADTGNNAIRKIDTLTNMVSTLAGTCTTSCSAGSADSTNGTGATASFSGLYGIASDGTNLYVADTGNHTIRQIVISTGVVTTLAGNALAIPPNGSADGSGNSARFSSPNRITPSSMWRIRSIIRFERLINRLLELTF